MNNESIIKAAINVLIEPILKLLQDDPHQWTSRPCTTCKTITSMIGESFGCIKWHEDRIKSKKEEGGNL